MKTQTHAHIQTNFYIVHQGRRGKAQRYTQRHTHQKKMKTLQSQRHEQTFNCSSGLSGEKHKDTNIKRK